MTIETLKPVLLVIIIGLVMILSRSPLDEQSLSGISISAHFKRLVSACQNEHPTWERETCERIVRGELWIGMTDEMLRAALGEPRRIEHPRDEDPTYETWFYYTARYGEEIFQFRDGLLIGTLPGHECPTCTPHEDRVIGE